MSIRNRILEALNVSSGDARDLSESDFKKLSKKAVEEVATAIKRPNAEWERITFRNKFVGSYNDGKYPETWDTKGVGNSIVLKNAKEGINLIFNISFANYRSYSTMNRITKNRNQDDFMHELVSVRGSTEFKNNDKWFTFDKRGIDDSFSIGQYSNYKDISSLPKLVKDQIKRVHDAKNRQTNAVKLPAPLDKFTKTAKDIEDIKKTLASGKDYMFSPSGMGTGYILTKRRMSGHEGAKASSEIDSIFGIALYIGRYDAD